MLQDASAKHVQQSPTGLRRSGSMVMHNSGVLTSLHANYFEAEAGEGALFFSFLLEP